MGDQWSILILLLVGMTLAVLYLRYIAQRNRRRQEERSHLRTITSEQNDDFNSQSMTPSLPRQNTESAQILLKHTQQARARRGLVSTFSACPVMLANLIYYRAVILYQEEQGCSWQDAWKAVEELFNQENGVRPVFIVSAADPVVTMLLLQAGCRDDAITYFCQSTGADSKEALFAINYIQRLIDTGNTLFLEHQKRDPDPYALQFLLAAGYRLLAILYYRDCTDASLMEASAAIDQIKRSYSNGLFRYGITTDLLEQPHEQE